MLTVDMWTVEVVFVQKFSGLALRCDKRLYASLAGFEGCVTQGCDEESFETAKDLALSHPLRLGLCVCLGVMEWWNQDSSWFGFYLYLVSFVFLFTEILRYSRLEKYRLNMPTLRPKGWQVHKLIQLQGMTNPGDGLFTASSLPFGPWHHLSRWATKGICILWLSSKGTWQGHLLQQLLLLLLVVLVAACAGGLELQRGLWSVHAGLYGCLWLPGSL